MIVTKDRREIELMAEAGRIVALVHEKLKEVIVPGITTKQIDEICEKVIRDNNATPSFLHLYGFPNSVCTSINEVVVHGIPSDRKLEEGDIISVDVGACYKGYHGDSAWTYAVGKISDEAKRLMEVCEASLYAGLEQVKPGNRLSDISHAVQVYLEDHGCTTPLDYTGHGIDQIHLVKVMSTSWLAASVDNNTINEGEYCEIMAIEGAHLVVKKIEE